MKKIIYDIVTVIFVLVAIPLLFYLKINDGEVPLNTIPYAIIFDISIWVLLFIIYKIGDDMCYSSKETKIGKFKVFKFLNNLKQDGKLKEYENFCISIKNKEIVSNVQLYLPDLDYNDVYELVRNKQLEKIKENIKKSNVSNWKEQYKKVEDLILHYDTPTNFNVFISYYNNTLLQDKNNIFSLLTGFISFIISIVSLLGIGSFQSISFEFYSAYIFPVLYGLYQVISYYIKGKKTACKYYDEILEKFIEQYNLFENSNTQDS